jgi:hypothetical protein
VVGNERQITGQVNLRTGMGLLVPYDFPGASKPFDFIEGQRLNPTVRSCLQHLHIDGKLKNATSQHCCRLEMLGVLYLQQRLDVPTGTIVGRDKALLFLSERKKGLDDARISILSKLL